MNPDHDPTRRPRKYYEEDQEHVEDDGVIGVFATLAVVCGVVISFIIGAVIGGIILFDKYKHWLGL